MSNVLLKIFCANKDKCGVSSTFLFIVLCSSCDVIEQRHEDNSRPWNCAGSPILFLNFWTSSTSCNVVNLGKIFPSNSIGSPSVVSEVLLR